MSNRLKPNQPASGSAPDGPDPMTVIRTRDPADPPGELTIGICRRSLARRLADGARAQPGARVDDLGPGALLMTSRFERLRDQLAPGAIVKVGRARGREWLTWAMPSKPVEPIPGTPGETGLRN